MKRINDVPQLEYYKAYDITCKLDELIEAGAMTRYTKGKYKCVIVYADINDLWIHRVIEDCNKAYEEETGKWLVERVRVAKHDLCGYIKELKGDVTNTKFSYYDRYFWGGHYTIPEIFDYTLRMDDAKELALWDVREETSYDRCRQGFCIISNLSSTIRSLRDSAIQMGFESLEESNRLISALDLFNATTLDQYNHWKETDGTKKGLVELSEHLKEMNIYRTSI